MIDIVIVNWNAGDQLAACVGSIRTHGAGLVGRVVVVDNGSTDGSCDFLSGDFEVDLVRTGANLGFARACNLGAARGASPFVLFLNPDAELLAGSLARPYALLSDPANGKIGIAGVALRGERGDVERSCARFPGVGAFLARSSGVFTLLPRTDFCMVTWDHSETRFVDHVIGAFFFVRRDLFQSLGGFDERFFVYLEDLDFSLRASLAGFRTIFLADSHAFHAGGGTSAQVKAHRLFYSLRSRILYAFKHFSVPGAVVVALAALILEPCVRLAWLMLRRRAQEVPDLFRGFGMLWRWSLRSLFRLGARA